MNRWMIVALATAMAVLGSRTALADGSFIAAPNRTDMIDDPARGIIYIADGTQVLRYGIDCGCQLDPVQLGGDLKGMDLSPDGNTLAVADGSVAGGKAWVHLVDLDTLQDTKASYDLAYMEVGTFSVSYAADGGLVTTSSFAGSGWVPLRRLDPSTLIWTTLDPAVRQDTMLAASAKGEVVGFAESNISDGRWGAYYPSTGAIDRRQWYDDGTSAFNFEIGVNGTGSQFAIPTYFGTYVYDASYQKVATIGVYASGQPIGVAYDPGSQIAYFPWATTGDVRAYDMQTFQQIGSYDFEDSFESTGNSAFRQGRTRLSRDGSLLMVSVTGGVRFLRLHNPLSAAPVSGLSTGGRIQIPLQGSIGSGGRPGYGLSSLPAHGKAFVDGDILTYVPNPGFSGRDTFSYAAHYGAAVAVASVTIDVTADTSAYSPLVSFGTLPALSPTSAIPGSAHVSNDFNGDGTSDLLWFNNDLSQGAYWLMSASTAPASRIGARVFNVTPGYFIAASGDLNGDGFSDLVYTSAARDLWLWTNNKQGGFSSKNIGSYPASWQLIGAGDINGDGYDDLLWLDPSNCQYAYWLMKGDVRIGSRVLAVTCGYYPTSIGYYTPSNRISVLWTSAANDFYMWDSTPDGMRSYNLSADLNELGGSGQIWAIGGGFAGQGIGIESVDGASGTGKGALLSRTFAGIVQSGTQGHTVWAGAVPIYNPGSGGYLVQSQTSTKAALYTIDSAGPSISTLGLLGDNPVRSGSAPKPDALSGFAYPFGWHVVGAPANGAAPLPWR